ncbi:MAG: heavy-metal-associated domain-containing protein [Chloroflexi bacterium]|nr:heavy-metal-associated domain-containing protein [Chloroflexota bacterium]
MKEEIIALPAMYADHHVLSVRQALLNLPGVNAVWASAARRSVKVRYDEASLASGALYEALEAAGYPPGRPVALAELPERHKDGSAWHTILGRATRTEMKDREMAGDFRRY